MNNNKNYIKLSEKFDIDKICIVGIHKIYNVTIAMNMLITLFTTILTAKLLNHFNIFYYNYEELFLTCIIIFIIWNVVTYYLLNIKTYSIGMGISLLLAIFILPYKKSLINFIKQLL